MAIKKMTSVKKADPPKKKQELTKEQKQGMFNQTLVQGGSKNPAINPEKYYPSMYGKGRVGDKPAAKKSSAKESMMKGASKIAAKPAGKFMITKRTVIRPKSK